MSSPQNVTVISAFPYVSLTSTLAISGQALIQKCGSEAM